MRESTSTKSRLARVQSRVMRLGRLLKLSGSKRLRCACLRRNGGQTKWPNSTPEQVVRRLDACSASCSVVPRRSNQGEHLGQLVQGEPLLPCDGREAAACATRRCVCGALWQVSAFSSARYKASHSTGTLGCRFITTHHCLRQSA